VHYVELDQFVGPNYLVTVHGPLNPTVNPEAAFVDTRLVLRRIEQDEIHSRTPRELSYSIVSALARREIDLVAAPAKESGRLEQQVTDENRNDDPEVLLEDLFQVGHQLLAICTMATHSAAAYGGMTRRVRSIPDQEKTLVGDLAGRFEMVRSMGRQPATAHLASVLTRQSLEPDRRSACLPDPRASQQPGEPPATA
jgi:magnesium transporter